MTEKSELEQIRRDVEARLEPRERLLWDDVLLYVEKQREEQDTVLAEALDGIDGQIEDLANVQEITAIAEAGGEGWLKAMSLIVAIGQQDKVGWIDKEGSPTAMMPDQLRALYGALAASFAEYKPGYEDQFGEMVIA